MKLKAVPLFIFILSHTHCFAQSDSAVKRIGLVPKIDVLAPVLGLLNNASEYSISLEKKLASRESIDIAYHNFYGVTAARDYTSASTLISSQKWVMLEGRYYCRKSVIREKLIYDSAYVKDTTYEEDSIKVLRHIDTIITYHKLKPLNGPYFGFYAKYMFNHYIGNTGSFISVSESNFEYYDKGLAVGGMIGIQYFIKDRIGVDFHVGLGARHNYNLHVVQLHNFAFSLIPWQVDGIINLDVGYKL